MEKFSFEWLRQAAKDAGFESDMEHRPNEPLRIVGNTTQSSRVSCDIVPVGLEGDYDTVDGVQATCDRCGHVTESFGTSERSEKRCLVLMREECPRGESNWYVAREQDDVKISPAELTKITKHMQGVWSLDQ